MQVIPELANRCFSVFVDWLMFIYFLFSIVSQFSITSVGSAQGISLEDLPYHFVFCALAMTVKLE
jgi:hypothetical protein